MNHEGRQSTCDSRHNHKPRHADGSCKPLRLERYTSDVGRIDDIVESSSRPALSSFPIAPPFGALDLALLPSSAKFPVPVTF